MNAYAIVSSKQCQVLMSLWVFGAFTSPEFHPNPIPVPGLHPNPARVLKNSLHPERGPDTGIDKKTYRLFLVVLTLKITIMIG